MMIQKTGSVLRRQLLTASSSSQYQIRKREYTVALTRKVSKSLPKALSSNSSNDNTISYDIATSQHAEYVRHLRTILPTLLLPEHDNDNDTTEELPDSVFIEDTAIVIRNKALITRIGAPSRQAEVNLIKSTLLSLGLDVTDMREACPHATCDGGDVLLPVSYHRPSNHDDNDSVRNRRRGGKHLFVGLSSRTNRKGVQLLQSTFQDDDVQVIPVPLPTNHNHCLHLKSIVTHIDEHTLIAPTGPIGDSILSSMSAHQLGYDVIRLPDMNACNVVAVHDFVFATRNCSDECRLLLEDAVVRERGLELVYVDASELNKCDGALTCMSLLLDLDLDAVDFNAYSNMM